MRWSLSCMPKWWHEGEDGEWRRVCDLLRSAKKSDREISEWRCVQQIYVGSVRLFLSEGRKQGLSLLREVWSSGSHWNRIIPWVPWWDRWLMKNFFDKKKDACVSIEKEVMMTSTLCAMSICWRVIYPKGQMSMMTLKIDSMLRIWKRGSEGWSMLVWKQGVDSAARGPMVAPRSSEQEWLPPPMGRQVPPLPDFGHPNQGGPSGPEYQYGRRLVQVKQEEDGTKHPLDEYFCKGMDIMGPSSWEKIAQQLD